MTDYQQTCTESRLLTDKFWRVNPWFREGWESFSFDTNGWTKGNNPEIVQTYAHHGGMSVKTSSTAYTYNGIRKDISAKSNISVRFFMFTPYIPFDTNVGNMFELCNGSTRIFQFGVSSIAELPAWKGVTQAFYAYMGGMEEYIINPLFYPNQWYEVDIYYTSSGSNRNVKIYINNILAWEVSAGTASTIDNVRFQMWFNSASSYLWEIYFDDIAFDDNPIGYSFDPVDPNFLRILYDSSRIRDKIISPIWLTLKDWLLTHKIKDPTSPNIKSEGYPNGMLPFTQRVIRTSDGTLHYIWTSDSPNVKHYYSSDNGKNWNVTTLFTDKNIASVAKDSNDNLVLVASYGTSSTVFRKATVNKLVSPWTWSWGSSKGVSSYYVGTILVDSSDYFHFSGQTTASGKENKMVWAYCSDGQGNSWTATEISGFSTFPIGGIVIDSKRNLFLFGGSSNGSMKACKIEYDEILNKWNVMSLITINSSYILPGPTAMLPDDRIVFTYSSNFQKTINSSDISSWTTPTSMGASMISTYECDLKIFSNKVWRFYYTSTYPPRSLRYVETGNGGSTWSSQISLSTVQFLESPKICKIPVHGLFDVIVVGDSSYGIYHFMFELGQTSSSQSSFFRTFIQDINIPDLFGIKILKTFLIGLGIFDFFMGIRNTSELFEIEGTSLSENRQLKSLKESSEALSLHSIFNLVMFKVAKEDLVRYELIYKTISKTPFLETLRLLDFRIPLRALKYFIRGIRSSL